MISNLKNITSNGFVMLKLMENDTHFVIVAHLITEILHFMVFNITMAAILDLGQLEYSEKMPP